MSPDPFARAAASADARSRLERVGPRRWAEEGRPHLVATAHGTYLRERPRLGGVRFHVWVANPSLALRFGSREEAEAAIAEDWPGEERLAEGVEAMPVPERDRRGAQG